MFFKFLPGCAEQFPDKRIEIQLTAFQVATYRD
jgi:hypothetical protein